MRSLLTLAATLLACAPTESLPTVCAPACGAGQVCINAMCLVAADGGTDAARDVPGDDVAVADVPADVIPPADVLPDVMATDAGDAPGDVTADVAPDAVVCPMGFGDCDGMAANGCETDVRTNFNHCGRCGMRCPSPGETPVCNASHCGIVCGVGFANCDRRDVNGCETRLDTSANCGACGVSCGLRACVRGACS